MCTYLCVCVYIPVCVCVYYACVCVYTCFHIPRNALASTARNSSHKYVYNSMHVCMPTHKNNTCMHANVTHHRATLSQPRTYQQSSSHNDYIKIMQMSKIRGNASQSARKVKRLVKIERARSWSGSVDCIATVPKVI